MITSNSSTKTLSNINGTAVNMSFDAGSLQHLMGIMTNLYSNKKQSVLREYVANGIDSHKDAGYDGPVLVTLPTEWKPNLVIQDFGVGLSKDDLVSVYAKYGASTKRDSNTGIGGFGIGGKSAFTVASQFVVSGVKNGVKTTAIFAQGEAGGNVTILEADEATDAPNGVTVSIGVNDEFHEWETVAAGLFSTFPKGSVLVNGSEPISLFDGNEFLQVTDNLFANASSEGGYIKVVMGGIAYPADSNMVYKLRKSIYGTDLMDTWKAIYNGTLSLVVISDIGSVDITPSREALQDSDKTIAVLKNALVEYKNNIKCTIETLVDSAPNAIEAGKIIRAHKDFLTDPEKGITYKGSVLPYKIEIKSANITSATGRNGKATARLNSLINLYIIQDMDNYLVVTGCDEKTNENALRIGAIHIFKETDYKGIILSADDSGSQEWFSWGKGGAIETITIDEYKELVKQHKPARSGGTIERDVTTYRARVDGKWSHLSLAELKKINRRVVVCEYYESVDHGSPLFEKSVDSTDVIVELNSRQQSTAMLKRLPGSIRPRDLIKFNAQKIVEGISQATKAALTFSQNSKMDALALIATKAGDVNVLGSEVAQYVQAKADAAHLVENDRNLYRAALQLTGQYIGSRAWEDEEAGTLFPLLAGVYYRDLVRKADHCAEYVKALRK